MNRPCSPSDTRLSSAGSGSAWRSGELVFEIGNDVRPGALIHRDGDAYGGIAMLEAIARLCEWRALRFEPGAGTFSVSWRVPGSERATTGAD